MYDKTQPETQPEFLNTCHRLYLPNGIELYVALVQQADDGSHDGSPSNVRQNRGPKVRLVLPTEKQNRD